jgi:hypothetical protein
MFFGQDTAAADDYTSRGSYRHRISGRCSISHSGQTMSEGREEASVVGIPVYHSYLDVGATVRMDKELSKLAVCGRAINYLYVLKACGTLDFSGKRTPGSSNKNCAILNSFGVLPLAILFYGFFVGSEYIC